VGATVTFIGGIAVAEDFDISGGTLAAALDRYAATTGVDIVVSAQALKGIRTTGVVGKMSRDEALSRLLRGTGFVAQHEDEAIAIVRSVSPQSELVPVEAVQLQLAQAVPARAAVETVTVTSSKLGGADVQSIPIAITALSQEQLTATQTAGGPDLVKQVPNLTFSKTNFTGYNIQIRGIGTQAISVSTDPAVAVALNDTPFIRNHFFEQEFYDVSQVAVLRGPQGTLYGRNATAGVVNVVTAKPTDQFEASASADIGNYKNRRFEGMINIPIVDDRLDLRMAGEWTKRDGYTTNAISGNQVDGRDLWSARATLGVKPFQNVQATLVWEHFQEDDDRMRTAKQLCHRDGGPDNVLGAPVTDPQGVAGPTYLAFTITKGYLSQGCKPSGLYSADSFQVPYGYALPYVEAGYLATPPLYYPAGLNARIDPYTSTTQSQNLRVIETQINPIYKAKNDTLELNADYNITPAFIFTSQTGYNNDFLWSTEDYNRFNTSSDIFNVFQCNGGGCASDLRVPSLIIPDGNYRCFNGGLSIGGSQDCDVNGAKYPTGYFCDPQLGCSSRLVAQDLSTEHAWQVSQEFRLASKLSGPLNFSVGGNYLHYETIEKYYVFANALTMYAASLGAGQGDDTTWVLGISDNSGCLARNLGGEGTNQYHNPSDGAGGVAECYYIDPNPLAALNDQGHNYFLSENPYTLNSYAGFGEAYYNPTTDLKLTAGIRWTDDRKHFVDIPSELLARGQGYVSTGSVDQVWDQFTGRLAANWTPKLDFTEQTLVYGSFAHGYKAGGANPPGPVLGAYSAGVQGVPIHPLTFKPEFINAYEMGTKNTLLDGGLTLNGDIFFYDYTNYQISRIVDRTAINDNFNATVKGAEVEASYEPLPGLKFNFSGGFEQTRVKNGQSSIDLIDRTDSANHPNWMIMKPFVSQPSNCVFPDYVIRELITDPGLGGIGGAGVSACGFAYTGANGNLDPATQHPYTPFPFGPGALYYNPGYSAEQQAYPGYDPAAPTAANPYHGQNTYNGVDYGPAPNNGDGFAKDLSGHELPNAPHFTVSFGTEYTIPVSEDWAASLHGDFYWQAASWARVFNDDPYDRIHGYTNVNLALVLTSQNGWQVMGYVKNLFDTTAITGDFLNSDDSGLTTNVFLTDPRLFGVRVTKNW